MAGLQAPRALPALACVLLALLPGPAVADGIGQIAGGAPAAYCRLFQAPPPTADMEMTEQEASTIKDAVTSADGQAGPYTEWVVPCEPERSRCPSLFLASWGYQCTTLDGDSCCLQPNGKFCTRLERWQGIAAPASWRGWDNATSTAAATSSGRVAAQQQQGGGNSSSTTMLNQRAGKPRKEGKTKEGEEEQDSGKPRKEGKAKEEEQDSGKPWRIATATHFTSYPPCCENRKADRTECDKFNGCEWAGQFAGVSGKKSRSWIRERNIVAMFEAGRSKEWSKRWRGKTLRIKNPKTGNTLEVQVLDTCADSDCDGCCTTNARKNGGVLIDLESATAERFWEGEVQDLAAIEWQVV